VLTYSAPCWTTLAPTFYVWMRVLWNPELDVDATLDENVPAFVRTGRGQRPRSPAAGVRAVGGRNLDASPARGRHEKASGGFPALFRRSAFPGSWPLDVVARMKALRDRALAEMSGDPNARQAFLYWTWTFDEFVKEANPFIGTQSERPMVPSGSPRHCRRRPERPTGRCGRRAPRPTGGGDPVGDTHQRAGWRETWR